MESTLLQSSHREFYDSSMIAQACKAATSLQEGSLHSMHVRFQHRWAEQHPAWIKCHQNAGQVDWSCAGLASEAVQLELLHTVMGSQAPFEHRAYRSTQTLNQLAPLIEHESGKLLSSQRQGYSQLICTLRPPGIHISTSAMQEDAFYIAKAWLGAPGVVYQASRTHMY